MLNKLYALTGSPLAHSFSKYYFEEKFLREQINNCSFQNIEHANQETFFSFLISLKRNEERYHTLQGFCITMPYKECVLPYLDSLSAEGKEIRAINCVKISREGKDVFLHGENTDHIGFSLSLLEHVNPKNTKALILGSGGAMRAVAYSLKKNKIPYKIASRQENTEQNYITYPAIDSALLSSHNLIINTTPCGMGKYVNQIPPIDCSLINETHTVFDLIYNPEQTLLLSIAQRQGAKTINGYDMLCYQAEENWRIWNTKA